MLSVMGTWTDSSIVHAEEDNETRSIKGVVQNQDHHQMPQALIEVRSQDGDIVSSGVSNNVIKELKLSVPEGGTYSVVRCKRPIGANMSC
ncbi:MAG: hypothetical protein QM706_16770 [Nitrospira sp.]